MLVVPAVDILDRKVVRAVHGLETTAKIYSSDPFEVVKFYSESGARIIHIVDLDSAINSDSKKNEELVQRILAAFADKVRIQLGGGIRSIDRATSLLGKGAFRIVIGSLAYSDPCATRSLLESKGPDKVVLALDYDDSGMVRTNGWKGQQTENVYKALQRNLLGGFRNYLLTSISQDGTLEGPDLETLKECKKILRNSLSSTPRSTLIASGGIASSEDLLKLSNFGIDEAIIGKAFFEGKLDVSETLRSYRS